MCTLKPKNKTMCAYAEQHTSPLYAPPPPPPNLNPCGWGCKRDLVVSVYLLSLTLVFLRGTRAMFGALHEGWGYILRLPLRLLPSPSSHSPIVFQSLIRIPLRSSNVLLTFNHAGEPDANEPGTDPVRSNWDKQWEMSLPAACPGQMDQWNTANICYLCNTEQKIARRLSWLLIAFCLVIQLL